MNKKTMREELFCLDQEINRGRKTQGIAKGLVNLFRQLSVILESGVALAQGMILIAENMTNAKLAYCVQTIAFQLNAGEELSSSLRKYPKVFEPIAIGLIEAGEAGGILEQVLDRIALLLEERAKIRGQIIGALIYPALVFASQCQLRSMVFIVPKFKTMFDNRELIYSTYVIYA